MCLVLADDHRFLIGCKSARTAPANSGSLKVPGPIQANFAESSVYTGPELNQLCSTQSGPETLSPRGACKDYLLQANRYPGGFSVVLGSCLLLQNTSECVRAAILKTKKKASGQNQASSFCCSETSSRIQAISPLSFAALRISQTLNPPAFIGAHKIYPRPYNSQMSE